MTWSDFDRNQVRSTKPVCVDSHILEADSVYFSYSDSKLDYLTKPSKHPTQKDFTCNDANASSALLKWKLFPNLEPLYGWCNTKQNSPKSTFDRWLRYSRPNYLNKRYGEFHWRFSWSRYGKAMYFLDLDIKLRSLQSSRMSFKVDCSRIIPKWPDVLVPGYKSWIDRGRNIL